MSELKDLKLKVGDKVKAFGVEGIVVAIDDSNNYPFSVNLDGIFQTYTKDGRQYKWHKTPSLEVIERVKTKVKRAKYLFKTNSMRRPEETSGYYKDEVDFLDSFIGERDSFKFIIRLDETEREFEE